MIPRLSVADPEACVEFLRDVLDAEGSFQAGRPSELRIGESLIMVGGILERAPSASFLYVYLPDVNSAFATAIALGATAIEEPAETPYGDRRAMFEDLWGNRWQIATHRSFAANI